MLHPELELRKSLNGECDVLLLLEAVEGEEGGAVRPNLPNIIIHHLRLSIRLNVNPGVDDLDRLRDTGEVRPADIGGEL